MREIAAVRNNHLGNWENRKEIAFESTMGHFNCLFLMASKANLASLSKVFLSAMHNYLIE